MGRRRGAAPREWACSGKRRYRDGKEAKRALTSTQAWSTRDRVPVRAYQCHGCHGWHLTSQALDATEPGPQEGTGLSAGGRSEATEATQGPARLSGGRGLAADQSGYGRSSNGDGKGQDRGSQSNSYGDVRDLPAQRRRYWPGQPVSKSVTRQEPDIAGLGQEK